MKWDGTIILIDPCSVVKSNADWHTCAFGADMSALGFTQFLYADVGSDGSGCMMDTDSNEKIGTFCTDSCVLVVLYFDELLQYHPAFSHHIRYPQNSVILHDFSGEIHLDDKNSIVGCGNINFTTA